MSTSRVVWIFLALVLVWVGCLQVILIRQTADFIPIGEASNDRRLLYYTGAHRIDPLLAIEGTDLDSFVEAIDALKESEQLIRDTYVSRNEPFVMDTLRPWNFLESLARTESLRRELLLSPTRERAYEYHDSLLETMDYYIKDTRSAATTLETLEEKHVAFWAGTTSSHHIAQILRERIRSTEKLRATEKRRYRCLNTLGYPCPATTYPSVSAPSTAADQPSDRVRFNASVIEKVASYSGTDSPSPTLDTQLPIIAIENSACTANIEPLWLKAWWATSATHPVPAVRFSQLNELYFFDYSLRDAPGAHVLRDAGISLEFQYFNPYICADYAQDTGTALAMFAIIDQLREGGIFQKCAEDKCRDLRAAEERLLSQDAVSSFDVGTYMSLGAQLLSAKGERGLAEYIGDQQVFALERMIALWRGKSAHVEGIFGVIDHIAPYTALIAYEKNLPADILAVHRGHYSVLFFTANETFGGTPLLLPEKNPTVFARFPIRTYENHVQDFVSPSKLPDFIRQTLTPSEKIVREMFTIE